MRDRTLRSRLSVEKRSRSNPEIDAKWISRGIISACECFSCSNKIDHRLRGNRVSVLCSEHCRYSPLKGETRPELGKMADIEQYI